jgi:AraC-like DNA-binding protein
LLLIGQLDEAERSLTEIDSESLPPTLRAAHELIVAGIAMRRLRTRTARAALARAARAAQQAGIAALIAEVDNASRVLDTPAARLIARGQERLLLLEDVEALLASGALVADACRYAVRDRTRVISLASARKVVVLARPLEEEHAAVLAFLADGEAWSSSALALALGASQRTVQRSLDELAGTGKVQFFGRGRARRWITPPVPGFTTTLLLPAPLPGD